MRIEDYTQSEGFSPEMRIQDNLATLRLGVDQSSTCEEIELIGLGVWQTIFRGALAGIGKDELEELLDYARTMDPTI